FRSLLAPAPSHGLPPRGPLPSLRLLFRWILRRLPPPRRRPSAPTSGLCPGAGPWLVGRQRVLFQRHYIGRTATSGKPGPQSCTADVHGVQGVRRWPKGPVSFVMAAKTSSRVRGGRSAAVRLSCSAAPRG